jgi:hypothetical protein
MLSNFLTVTVAVLASSAVAHGDHEHQVPIAGPHKALWYNTLPGDGGTQVCPLTRNRLEKSDSFAKGRFGFLWDFDVRSFAVLPMSGFRRCEI